MNENKTIALDIISDDGIHCNSVITKKLCPQLRCIRFGTQYQCLFCNGAELLEETDEKNLKNSRLKRHPNCIESSKKFTDLIVKYMKEMKKS